MKKDYSSTVFSFPKGSDQAAPAEAIWCIHYECYKYVKVCGRCRVRIKCANYQDYWAPRFDFRA